MTKPRQFASPIHVPEDPARLEEHLQAVLDAFREPLLGALRKLLEDPTPETMLGAEELLHRILGNAGAHLLAGLVQALHQKKDFVDQATEEIRAGEIRKLRSRGFREAPVRFLGGPVIRIRTPYLTPDKTGQPGRRRKVGRRGKAGSGCYPVLTKLGVEQQATPALMSEVARQSVRCASFAEASEALSERGIPLDAKSVRRIALAVGNAAIEQRQRRIQAAANGLEETNEFEGRRIVISVDGGRIRFRKKGKKGKGKGGRPRFHTPWKEPKVLCIYVIDENGKKVRSVAPVLDATMGDPDFAFEILLSEILLRGGARAAEIVVVADGAPWIWNRVNRLAERLGIPKEKIHRVADFYHAVEHLTKVAKLVPGWREKAEKTWVKRMRRRLRMGKVDQVISEIRKLCQGRRAGKIKTELNYFEERREQMRYDVFSRKKLPLGSGGVESAVRRVVNLRFKGAAMFWKKSAAEPMLHLRSYLKAGRWSELISRVIHGAPVRRIRNQRRTAA